MRLISIVLLLALAREAAAEASFVWQAPAGCPDVTDIRLRIEQRLGATTVGAIDGIEVEIAHKGAGFVATIDASALTVANAIRTVESGRCDELADAVALIVARLAREASENRPRATPQTEAPPPRVAVVDDESIDRREPVAPAIAGPRIYRYGGRVVWLSGIGAQPGVGIGVELAGYLRRHDYAIDLAYSRWDTKSRALQAGAPGAVDVLLWDTILRAGWAPAHMPIRAWVSGELGELAGRGRALFDNRIGSTRWIAAGAGFGVAWPISAKSRVVGAIEVAAPFDRPKFQVVGSTIYQPFPVVARTVLGIEVGL